MRRIDQHWADTRSALDAAVAIAFDGCHKIYLLMDPATAAEFVSYGYEPEWIADADDALATLRHWYDQSCFLRFITAVRSNPDNPNAGYTDLIPQGAEEEDE